MFHEFWYTLTFRRQWELAIVVCRANPHIVHETWKTDHHGSDTKDTAELELSTVVDLGI